MKPRKIGGQSSASRSIRTARQRALELVLRHSRRGEEREYSSVAQLVARK